MTVSQNYGAAQVADNAPARPKVILTRVEYADLLNRGEKVVTVIGVRESRGRWHWTKDLHEGYITRWSQDSWGSFAEAFEVAQRVAACSYNGIVYPSDIRKALEVA